MKTILFPTDFSSLSKNAEKFAIEIAKRKNAKLILLHIDNDNDNDRENVSFSSYDDTDALVKDSPITRLKKIIDTHGLGSHPHACFVEEGKIADIIINKIAQQDVDVVVMGTEGNRNFERKNSYTTEVIRHAKCSVLAIPQQAEYKPVSNIVYATDLIHRDGQSFKHLVSFAKVFEAKITLLHINVNGTEDIKQTPFKSFSEIVDEINYSDVKTEKVTAPNVVEGVERYAMENDVDVIAMTSHSTSFLDKYFRENNTKEMVLTSDIPILTFSK